MIEEKCSEKNKIWKLKLCFRQLFRTNNLIVVKFACVKKYLASSLAAESTSKMAAVLHAIRSEIPSK